MIVAGIFVFWLCSGLVFYTFFGYPIFLRLLNICFGRKSTALPDSETESPPSVTYVIVVFNEEARIAERLRNLEECTYSGDREIIAVCAGCTDDTAEEARRSQVKIPLQVAEHPEMRGKASGLNAGVALATGDIVVFADARQRFDVAAVEKLVGPMRADPAIGAVSGSLEIESSSSGASVGMDLYWKLEKGIRNEEAKWDSVIGCTGAIYALRRELYQPIPEDTLIDDVIIPMHVLTTGARIAFVPDAKAYDPQTLATGHEKHRKVRTLAGNYQMLFRYPQWLLPTSNRCWWQLISHKYLRLAGPWLLVAILVSSLLLAMVSLFYSIAAGLQIACYLAGIVGLLLPRIRSKIVTIPAGFLFLQWQSLLHLSLCHH